MRKQAKGNKIIAFFRSIKNTFIYLLNISFVLSIASHWIAPSQFVLIAPFGLIFIPLVLIHLIIFLLYFRRRKFLSLTALILLLFSVPYFPRTLNYHTESESSGLKIASWNIKSFDLYHWTQKPSTRQDIKNFLKKEDCDILCLQEFHTNESTFDNIKMLQEVGFKYHYFYPAFSKKTGNQWGLAIFSKYPIRSARHSPLHHEKNKMNDCIEVIVRAKGANYTIRNAHFQSIYLDYGDYDYINNMKEEFDIWNPVKTFSLLKKILKAYRYREEQVKEYNKTLSANSEKTVLCCDLNDIPNSYAYSELSKNSNDAFIERGRGISNTTAILMAWYRIDYIFCSSDLKINAYKRLRTKLSDHHFIYTWIE